MPNNTLKNNRRGRELHFTRSNGDIDDLIDQLTDRIGGIHHPDLIREMIIAALKAGAETDDRADLKLMNSTMKEMRFTSKIFGPYRHVRKVTVFGSARTQPGEKLYHMAQTLGQKLGEAGYMVITGGGPGIMQAANEGAGSALSFGVNIRLPFEQRSNQIVHGGPRDITYKYFFNRKVAFLKEADAVVLFPGGFGTMDEAMETLTLLQNGKLYPLPLILIDEAGGTYWQKWREFHYDELLCRGNINKTDVNLFTQTTSPDDAVDTINRFYSRYHSLRYVKGALVIRLKLNIGPKQVDELNEQFSDILAPNGKIKLAQALPEESDEPEIAHLPRLVLDFNRKNFGRLHALIETLNNR